MCAVVVCNNLSVFDSRSRLVKDIPSRGKKPVINERGDWHNFQIIQLESAKAQKVVYKKKKLWYMVVQCILLKPTTDSKSSLS